MNGVVPELSIIIAARNAAALLDETLGGFPRRAPFPYEVIIQDAMSADGTEEVVRKHAELPVRFESARDTGIYDAWNRALARRRGQWVVFIGAGDRLDWAALAKCVAALKTLPDRVEYYATPVRLVTPGGEALELLSPSSSPLRDLPQGMSLPHPGLFHRATLFADRRFDASRRIAGDYEFLCRTLREKNVWRGDVRVVSMRTGGMSGNMDSMFESERELLQLSRSYFPRAFPYKPLLRLARSGGYRVLRRLCGARLAGCFADLPRLARGKPRLWSLSERAGVSLPPLSDCPRLDLLVATRGRVRELDRLLASLERQTYRNFHIFLADQDEPGYLDDMLARHTSLPLTRVMLPSRGVSIARNILLERARGDILVFPDDDCWYAPETLERVCAAFAEHPSCGALLGVWSPSPEVAVRGISSGVVGRVGLFRLAGTCVQFFRREAVAGLRFDPLLGPGTGLPYGCGEDTDYLLHAHERTEVRRDVRIRVFHPSPREQLPAPQKVASYAAGRMYLLKKHRFSSLFMAFNVLYPLFLAPIEVLRHGKAQGACRLRMFRERLRNWR
ncbi:glycosyltransferase [uncultured Desulfovibrio sp.]|uniref:glycosyltransferase family 2 protein n=1 Tax=uncultured Desulfovibrio sp. TaxID=167968 RepID=UPI0028037868|nr:glycosyltransferase [uncultured Desulfovibrio sp.]